MDNNSYVTFADGTSEVCSYLSYLPDLQLVYVILDDADWKKAIDVFGNSEKLQTITYSGVTISGYTHVDYIEPLSYGMKARLSPAR